MLISLIAVPYANDVARWGSANGPRAWLAAGLAEALAARGHTVESPQWIDLPREKRSRDSIVNLGYLAARASDATLAALQRSAFPIVLEGNCTQCVGPTGGVARADGSAGMIWYDAHGDMHTMATTSTGLLGGLPFGVCMGWDLDDWRERGGLHQPVDPAAAALIGASDLDPEEEHFLATHPIARLDAKDMMTGGGPKTAALLASRAGRAAGWYLHYDLDVSGTDAAPGGLTPAPFWPPRAELVDSVAAATRAVRLRCLGLASYDPAMDPEGKGAQLGIDIARAVVDNL